MKTSDLVQWQPSFKESVYMAIQKARGEHHYFRSSLDSCYICGRKKYYLFGFVKLIPIFDNEVKFICHDHGGKQGRTVFNCLTGDKIYIPPTKPNWYIWMRNLAQIVTLKSAITIRFIFFLFYQYLLLWRIIFPLRLLKHRARLLKYQVSRKRDQWKS